LKNIIANKTSKSNIQYPLAKTSAAKKEENNNGAQNTIKVNVCNSKGVQIGALI
jgi:hypothetical protein